MVVIMLHSVHPAFCPTDLTIGPECMFPLGTRTGIWIRIEWASALKIVMENWTTWKFGRRADLPAL